VTESGRAVRTAGTALPPPAPRRSLVTGTGIGAKMRHGDILYRQRKRPERKIVAGLTIVSMVVGAVMTVVLVQATNSIPTIRMPGGTISQSR
jgi:hypothetical protein